MKHTMQESVGGERDTLPAIIDYDNLTATL